MRKMLLVIIAILSLFLIFNCADTSFGESEPSAPGGGGTGGGTETEAESDTTAPDISTLIPANNAVNVDTTADLQIKFSETINIESGNIYIYKSDDTTVDTIALTSAAVTGSDTDTLSINPAGDLNFATNFYIKIDQNAIKDTTGNYFAGISDKTTWAFQTKTAPGPAITTLSPADNSNNITYNTNLTITFSEAVTADSGNIKLYKSPATLIETIAITSGQISGSGTTTITIDPSDDFDSYASYYIQIDSTALKNSSNTHFAGINDTTTWNFQVERTVFLTESFDYGSTTGDLDSMPSTIWSDIISSTTTEVQYSTTGYSSSGYSSGSGGSASGKNDPNGGGLKCDLAEDVSSGTLYLAFIIETSVVSTNLGFGVLFYNDTTKLGGISLGGKNPIPRYKMLFDDNATTIIGNGTSQCLIILKYDFSTNILSAFRDPDVTGAEPVATATFDFSGSPWANIDGITIDQTLNASGADNTYYIDEIKATKYWELLKE